MVFGFVLWYNPKSIQHIHIYTYIMLLVSASWALWWSLHHANALCKPTQCFHCGLSTLAGAFAKHCSLVGYFPIRLLCLGASFNLLHWWDLEGRNNVLSADIMYRYVSSHTTHPHLILVNRSVTISLQHVKFLMQRLMLLILGSHLQLSAQLTSPYMAGQESGAVIHDVPVM